MNFMEINLKEKLRAEGVNLSELSEMMGYKTDQNLHSVLGAGLHQQLGQAHLGHTGRRLGLHGRGPVLGDGA